MNSAEDKIRVILPPFGKKFFLIGKSDNRARSFLEQLSWICKKDMRLRFRTVRDITTFRGWAGSTTIVLLPGWMDNRDIHYEEVLYFIKYRRLTMVEFDDDLLRNVQSIENYE